VVGYQRFGGLCCLHLQDWRTVLPSPKCWYPITTLHTKTHKTTNYNATSVNTSGYCC